MSSALEQALEEAYVRAAAAGGSIMGARLFCNHRTDLAIDGMKQASAELQAATAALVLAMREVQARLAALTGEASERADA